MYPPSAKSENKIARIIVPDSRTRSIVVRMLVHLSEDLVFDLIPVSLGIENFRTLEVFLVSHHLPVSYSFMSESPNAEGKHEPYVRNN